MEQPKYERDDELCERKREQQRQAMAKEIVELEDTEAA